MKFSIVIPSYNQGEFLERTLLSVINQGVETEIIVIDGGSTDNSVEIIKKYEDKIAYWVSERDRGQSHALNKGFAKATGDIFGWQNSDDIYMPGAFKKVLEVFEKFPDIHHLALHDGGVGAEGGHCVVGGFAEDEAVAEAVDDVPEGTGGNEGKADENACGDRTFQQFGNPPHQHHEEHHAEKGEGVLPDDPAERHAEGHSLVLHEEQLEPVPQHRDALPQGHMGFDQDLDDLVNDHEQDAQQKQVSAFFHGYLRPVFSRMALPSTVVVACGTRRRRSLGMSLPVTRQMP